MTEWAASLGRKELREDRSPLRQIVAATATRQHWQRRSVKDREEGLNQ
ncbi:hypothetical protein V6U71_05125 [Sphingopyxis sp. J-6]